MDKVVIETDDERAVRLERKSLGLVETRVNAKRGQIKQFVLVYKNNIVLQRIGKTLDIGKLRLRHSGTEQLLPAFSVLASRVVQRIGCSGKADFKNGFVCVRCCPRITFDDVKYVMFRIIYCVADLVLAFLAGKRIDVFMNGFAGRRINCDDPDNLLVIETCWPQGALYECVEQPVIAVIGHRLKTAVIEDGAVDCGKRLKSVSRNIGILDIGCRGKIRSRWNDTMDHLPCRGIEQSDLRTVFVRNGKDGLPVVQSRNREMQNRFGIEAKLIFPEQGVGVIAVVQVSGIVTIEHTKTGCIAEAATAIRDLEGRAVKFDVLAIRFSELIYRDRKIGIFEHLLANRRIGGIVTRAISDTECLGSTIGDAVINFVFYSLNRLRAVIPES